MLNNISFKEVNLTQDIDTCFTFYQDAFTQSFNTKAKGDHPSGMNKQDYIQWFNTYASDNPGGVIHLWLDNNIVGQITMRVDPRYPGKGYINLFYLISELRGSGAGTLMHDYAIAYLKGQDCDGAQLSVSTTNQRAVAYYKKHGWAFAKINPTYSNTHLYQIRF